ncbi:MAG: DUF4174 domain-containing protein [Pseudomonadota bacterium]
MLRKLMLVLSVFAAFCAPAFGQSESGTETTEVLPTFSATETTPDEFLWTARPIVVFADTPADPRFQQQMEFLAERVPALLERDVVVVTDADADDDSEWRRKLRPRGFALVVLAKDGGVILRKPFPWDVREITRSIDKMPLRQQEIRHRRAVTQ